MRRHLGEFEQVLLYALLRAGDHASGLAIGQVIEDRTGRAISPGAVYTGLSRLEDRGLVVSKLGAPTAERGGKGKRLYRITASGRARLAVMHDALGELSRGLRPKLKSS